MSKKFRKFRRKTMSLIFFNPIIQWILAIILSLVIFGLFISSKRKITNLESAKKYRKSPVIFVFFHGRSAMLSPVIKMMRIPAYCITSQHTDGRMMAKLQRIFGMRPIYGSTTKGGVAVLREGVRAIKDKHASICMTVDGPSGPALQVKDGALYFARMTGAPIVPVCYSASNAKMLNRWDRYLIPKFFGTIHCQIGSPIYVDSKLHGEDFETKRKEIEDAMIKQIRELDSEFNLPEIEYGIDATEYKKRIRENKKAE